MIDIYGREWPEFLELCLVCHQPDNCGDCTHERLTDEQATELGAKLGWRPSWTSGRLAYELMNECVAAEPVLILVKNEDGSYFEKELTGNDLFVRDGQLRIKANY